MLNFSLPLLSSITFLRYGKNVWLLGGILLQILHNATNCDLNITLLFQTMTNYCFSPITSYSYFSFFHTNVCYKCLPYLLIVWQQVGIHIVIVYYPLAGFVMYCKCSIILVVLCCCFFYISGQKMYLWYGSPRKWEDDSLSSIYTLISVEVKLRLTNYTTRNTLRVFTILHVSLLPITYYSTSCIFISIQVDHH